MELPLAVGDAAHQSGRGARRLAHQHLARRRHRAEARGDVDRAPVPIPLACERGPGVDADAHRWKARLLRGLHHPQAQLHGGRRPRAAKHQPVADRLHLLGFVGFQHQAHPPLQAKRHLERAIVSF